MPNDVFNQLKVSGTKEEINQFEIAAKNGDEPFSIAQLYPMPKELDGISSPPNILSGIEYVKAKIEYDKEGTQPGVVESKPITRKQEEELEKKFGASNWYDWALKRWGTKWGSYSGSIRQKGKTFIKYDFD